MLKKCAAQNSKSDVTLKRLWTYQRWVVEVIVYYTEWTSWYGHAPKVDKNSLLVLFSSGSVGTIENFFGHFLDFWLKLTQIIHKKNVQWSFTGVAVKKSMVWFTFQNLQNFLKNKQAWLKFLSFLKAEQAFLLTVLKLRQILKLRQAQ